MLITNDSHDSVEADAGKSARGRRRTEYEYKKTDSSHLSEKIYLRAEYSPSGPLSVLDAYGGKGVIWREVGKLRNVENYISIEKEKGKNPQALCGDNAKILPRLDLSTYNVIDLDAYGCPVAQIEAVLKNPTLKKGTVIFVTWILAGIAKAPYKAAEYIGVTPQMIKKAQYLFVPLMVDALRAILAAHGIREWKYYEHADIGMHKIYCCFTK